MSAQARTLKKYMTMCNLFNFHSFFCFLFYNLLHELPQMSFCNYTFTCILASLSQVLNLSHSLINFSKLFKSQLFFDVPILTKINFFILSNSYHR